MPAMASGTRGSLAGIVLVVAVVAAGGYWLWSRSGEHPADPGTGAIASTSPAAAAPAPMPVAPVVAPLQTPESAGIPKDDCIAYPDGTWLPPLNGVKKAPPMVFHRMVPFAKVMRKEIDPRTGIEWYIHENGVRSTTRLQWKNGVEEAYAEIDLPRATAPIANDK
jgi:hypothetical protein